MAAKKNVKSQIQPSVFEVPIDSDLPSRIKNISKQTGLNTVDLFQKWVLQEESLIGLMQNNKSQTKAPTKTHIAPDTQKIPVQKQEKPETIDFDSPDYRKVLIKRANALKKEGMTLVKIAALFNEENLKTVTGKGKWYASSINNLLNSKV
jgi:hypothetical protein